MEESEEGWLGSSVIWPNARALVGGYDFSFRHYGGRHYEGLRHDDYFEGCVCVCVCVCVHVTMYTHVHIVCKDGLHTYTYRQGK